MWECLVYFKKHIALFTKASYKLWQLLQKDSCGCIIFPEKYIFNLIFVINLFEVNLASIAGDNLIK